MFLSHLPLTLPFRDGPRKISFVQGQAIDPKFANMCKNVLRQTRNAGAWPTSYGRTQPMLVLVSGDQAETKSYALDHADPIRMATMPSEVVIGDLALSRGVFPGLRLKGVSEEQQLTLLMAHEAYHSNELQRLQRLKVSRKAFEIDRLFQQAAQPE